jgi:small subunit ribosomal protein S21
MIIIEIKNGDPIDKSLKRLKKKFESTKVLKELRSRKEYVKPSLKRREEINKAIYINKKYGLE